MIHCSQFKYFFSLLIFSTFSFGSTVAQTSGNPSDNLPNPVQDSKRGPWKTEYDYDFNVETAILSGISPDPNRISNGTSTSQIPSSPGCPTPFKGRAWVYYGNPPRCHLPGYKGPCPENKIFLPQKSSNYGYCGCACNVYFKDVDLDGHLAELPRPYCRGKTNNGQERILAYRKEWDSCLPLFDQGQCKDGDWLILADNPLLGPFCEKRRCPPSKNETSYSFFDFRTNLCHSIGDVCSTTEYGTKRFATTAYDWTPACGEDSVPYFYASSVGPSDCDGNERFSSILKACVPRVRDADFEDVG